MDPVGVQGLLNQALLSATWNVSYGRVLYHKPQARVTYAAEVDQSVPCFALGD